jgi:hypothetical protein
LDLDASCRYYLSDYGDTGSSNIYEVFFHSGGTRAILYPLFQVDYRATLAYDRQNEILYLIDVDAFAAQTADVSDLNPILGPYYEGPSGFSDAEITGATWYQGNLYLADAAGNRIGRINAEDLTLEYYSAALVNQGDIAFGDDGLLKMASRSPARFYNIVPNATNEFLGVLPDSSSGLMKSSNGNFMLLTEGRSFLLVGNEDGDYLDQQIRLYLEGDLFIPRKGDLASDCLPQNTGAEGISNNFGGSENQVALLTHHPNPSTGNSMVEFVTSISGRTELELIDLNGRVVQLLFSGDTEAGVLNRMMIDTHNMPRGVYLYRLRNASEVISERVIIAN